MLRFTSSSKRYRLPPVHLRQHPFSRGVIITHREVMANLRAISHVGLNYALATAASPGCLSTMIGTGRLSPDPRRHAAFSRLFATQDFAMRPLQWLKLISKNRAPFPLHRRLAMNCASAA